MAVVRNAALLVMAAVVALAFDGWLAVDAAIFRATNGGLGLVVLSPEGPAGPTLADSIPVVLLALATVGVIVLGGHAVASVRTALRSTGLR
jgi:hypothetical protein